MLACCNAARLWNDTCINVDVLEKSVTCITFGQPLLSIPYVQEVLSKYPKFEDIVHSVFDQDDAFPKLFRNHYSSQQNEQGKSLKPITPTTIVPKLLTQVSQVSTFSILYLF